MKVVICYFILGLCFLIFGCTSSEYNKLYDDAEMAYLGDDVKKAEQELISFENFLKRRLENGPKEYLKSALILTNIRLFDVYSFLGEKENAENRIDTANELRIKFDDKDKEVITREVLNYFIQKVQHNDRNTPGWKK